jgi:lysophospholipase
LQGTSSNVFAAACEPIPASNTSNSAALALPELYAELISPGATDVPESAIFAQYPNPFRNYPSSTLVANQPSLELVDGGVSVAFQGNPIWPFLHRPEVDVLIVNDNSADTATNYPNGTEIYNTYVVSQAAGLTRMPVIPDADVFVAKGFNKNPTFFGCNTPDTLTIIWLP